MGRCEQPTVPVVVGCKRWIWSALVSSLLLVSSLAGAKEQALDAAPVESSRVRIDGILREWPRLSELSEVISGNPPEGDPRVSGTVGYDASAIYVVMRVQDEQLQRTSAFRSNEDHALFSIAFPKVNTKGYQTYEVALFPGVPGKSAGQVQWAGGGKIAGTQLVEAPFEGGLTFEAKIPWTAFAAARQVRSGLRGALRYHDADGTKRVVVGTSKLRDREMPRLSLEAEYAVRQALVAKKGLRPEPTLELIVNLTGGGMAERVALYERYLTITGWDYRNGSQFYYQDLQLSSPSQLRWLKAADVTGDGRADLVLRRHQGDERAGREYLEVWSFHAGGDAPSKVFTHEVAAFVGEHQVRNDARIAKHRGKPALVVERDVTRVDPEQWTATPAGGETHPLLLPWQAVTRRTYVYVDGKFELTDEVTGKPAMAGPRRGTRLWSGQAPSVSQAADPIATEAVGDGAPPARPPSPEELQEKVYALYRADRGAGKQPPRFDFVTNVAGDGTLERVLVHGKDLVVFGKRFKEGTSYEYTTIGVDNPADIVSVTASDVTGDGHAEVLVLAVLRAKASQALGGQVVTRHAWFVYKLRESGVRRIFAAEVGRSLDEEMIVGAVRFVPSGKAMGIELHPGRAVGWTQESYPFPEDRHPYAGLEPLLLPWTEQPIRRYHYRDGRYIQQ